MTLITTPLNSVLIGYLARSKVKLTRRFMHYLTISLLGATLIVALLSLPIAHFLISILYPQNYQMVKEYFLLANSAQVAYSISGIGTMILLRYCEMKNLFYVNFVYGGAFLALCIPAALLWGLGGFCLALFITCMMRILAVLYLGYRFVRKENESVSIRPEDE